MAETRKNELPDYLFRLMRERHLDSQRELAKESGMSLGVINKILNGGRVKADTLEKLARGLGMPPEIIFQKAGYLEDAPIPGGLSPLLIRIMSVFERLPEEDQDELLAMARLKLDRLEARQQDAGQQPGEDGG
jgi:transcriptional regulator with XRE-family HTH domain